MKVDIKIQSISDVVTNSSTEVFIRFSQSNKQDIKNIVDALLAIGSSYRFDDLFTIEMCINRYLVWDMYDNYEEIREKFKNHDDFYKYLETLSEKELANIEYKPLLDSSIVVRSFHKKKTNVLATMLVHKKNYMDNY